MDSIDIEVSVVSQFSAVVSVMKPGGKTLCLDSRVFAVSGSDFRSRECSGLD